jgi:hypothetical protein
MVLKIYGVMLKLKAIKALKQSSKHNTLLFSYLLIS